VNQVQVRRAAGLTFASALRAVLRQDPDVIMVGEVRDKETAEIAIAAAVTGHLVLSTVHTVDAAGALTRLMNMGAAPYLVAAGVSGVIAQRLVRRLCRRCRGRGADCTACVDGYRGRTGVFQILTVDDAIRDKVLSGASTTALRTLARKAGTGSLVDDARRKVAEGVTSPHEVSRVLQTDPGSSQPCRRCEADVPSGAVGCPRCGARHERRCACGRALRARWKFCPWCLRKAPCLDSVEVTAS
jgi:type II secretory ATPase GspE/PulE/Tfp pilus assembly ATPase PilB-like protein